MKNWDIMSIVGILFLLSGLYFVATSLYALLNGYGQLDVNGLVYGAMGLYLVLKNQLKRSCYLYVGIVVLFITVFVRILLGDVGLLPKIDADLPMIVIGIGLLEADRQRSKKDK